MPSKFIPKSQNKMRFKKGDNVIIIAGKDKGKKGLIKAVMPKTRKITVEGINIVKKRIKPSMQNPYPQVLEVERPIDSSNIAHIDPKVGTPTRVGYKIVDGIKVRFAKKSGEIIGQV